MDTKRYTVSNMENLLLVEHSVLDHGYIRLIDYMGDERSIVQAARVSYGKGTKKKLDDDNLIKYLIRHRHTSPLEMCEIVLHIKLPIFVARHWIRHRTASVNEYSARYSILDSEFYIPDVLYKQSTKNKQGSGDPLDVFTAHEILDILKRDCNKSFDNYDFYLDQGLSREIARIGLPLSTYTQWYWKIDLHNLLHFLNLRMRDNAQQEIREYAFVINDIIKQWVPNVWSAFKDYQFDAHTFSAYEMSVLKKLIRGDLNNFETIVLLNQHEYSKREIQEFFDALGIEL